MRIKKIITIGCEMAEMAELANEAHSTELAITISYPTSASEIIGVQNHSKKCLKIGYNLCFYFNNAQFNPLMSNSDL